MVPCAAACAGLARPVIVRRGGSPRGWVPPSAIFCSVDTLNTMRPQPTPVSANPRKPLLSSRRAAVLDVEGAADLLSALAKVEPVLQIEDCNLMLRDFGDSRRFDEVSKLFSWMKSHEMLNFASYSSYFKYLGLSQNPAKALQLYNSIPDKAMRVHASVCNSLLGCMTRNRRFESSLKLFDQMKRDGLSPDLVTYSTLLTGCSKLKNSYSKTKELLQELKRTGLQMDGVIYGSLLAICAANNLIEEAEEYFQEMKHEGHQPNVFHYSSLLNAYAVGRDHEKAEMLLQDMKSSGIAPNKIILTTLLKVYAKGGLFEKSLKLLAELEALGYAKTEMPYCILIDNFAKKGKLTEAKKLFAEMMAKDVKSDGYAYSIMILASCRNGLLQEAKQFAKEFEAKSGKYDLVMLNTMLRAYCNARDMESTMQTLRKMDLLKISPDWNTFHILIKFFCQEKLYQLAYKTIEDMSSKGYPLSEELCSTVILKLGKAGFPSEAFSVYNMLRYSTRTPRKSLHEKILNILVAAKFLKEAYLVMKDNSELIPLRSKELFASSFVEFGNVNLINDVLKTLQPSLHGINQDIFHKAIQRYLQNPEKQQLLLNLLQWMAGQGYRVDPSTRNLLLRNPQLFANKHLIADILSKQQAGARTLRTQMHK